MARFDIIDASGNAYQFVWKERRYLAQLAVLPVFLKFVTLALIFFFDLEGNLVRQALLMLPAFLAEGWLVANLVRFIFFGERWFPPYPGGGVHGVSSIADRNRGVKAGAIMYTLIKYLQAGAMAFVMTPDQVEPPPAEVSEMELFAALILFGIALYVFRFLWIYVPLAINVPAGKIAFLLRGFGISFYLMGTWLLSFVPPLILLASLSGVLLGPYEGDSAAVPLTTRVLTMLLQVFFDTLIALISTAAVAYGFRQMLETNEKK
ncbi:MAG: hypothetical protein EOM26_09775 [Alphaproteobacteria bacterium]|nr:hypothetical protein [Alphaproteobacteria bacterium]